MKTEEGETVSDHNYLCHHAPIPECEGGMAPGLSAESVRPVIDAFAKDHPEYGDPDYARGRCKEASSAFLTYASNRGVQGRLAVDEIDMIDGESHYAARVDDLYVDWTRRQFDPTAAFPIVQCARCDSQFLYEPKHHRCLGEWEAVASPLRNPYEGMTWVEESMTKQYERPAHKDGVDS